MSELLSTHLTGVITTALYAYKSIVTLAVTYLESGCGLALNMLSASSLVFRTYTYLRLRHSVFQLVLKFIQTFYEFADLRRHIKGGLA